MARIRLDDSLHGLQSHIGATVVLRVLIVIRAKTAQGPILSLKEVIAGNSAFA